jgi:hypothetical protein
MTKVTTIAKHHNATIAAIYLIYSNAATSAHYIRSVARPEAIWRRFRW